MAQIVEALTDEEMYLATIFQDDSGLELGEFAVVDEGNDDGCWRAWHFQWSWWRSKRNLQIDQCARSVGKSMSITLRAYAFPFVHPGQEMVITAPELVHLEPLTTKIEGLFYGSRLGRWMLPGGRSAVTHRPFQMNFKNGSRIIGRIPQRDGKGVKGIHPIALELDEAQDYPEPGWTELFETLNRAHADPVWRAHGVTKGVRDSFWKFSAAPDTKWKVHRIVAMLRPTWNDDERQEKVAQYGSREDPDYKRNILGEHGDSQSPIVVLHRLMAGTDDNTESDYNVDEYLHLNINEAWLREANLTIDDETELPSSHLDRYKKFWVGMDVGVTQHPSEILVLAEERLSTEDIKLLKKQGKATPNNPEETRLKLLTRISLNKIGSPDQKEVILKVIAHYRPVAFSFDSTGLGLPIFQDIQRNLESYPHIRTIVKGYNYSGKILVDFDKTIDVPEWATQEEIIKETGIMRNTVEYATDRLRYVVDNGRLWLPWDRDLIGEIQGQTYKVIKAALDPYGKKVFSRGKFHALDGLRMALLGWSQYGIEELVKNNKPAPVFDVFMEI